jgi:glycosyltransferase involved in cell wall biosynthesis
MNQYFGTRRVVLVMPCLNCSKHLRSSIEAFLAQDTENKKLIIMDGGSTDESHRIIADETRRSSTITWIRKTDTGISNALNIANSEINDSDIWGYLGADDILLPGTLRRVQQIFSFIPKLNGVYFDSYTLNPHKNLTLRRCPDLPLTFNSLILYGTIVGLQNIYIDGSLVKKYQFNEKSRFSMDYEFYLRLTRDGFVNWLHWPQPSSINIADGNISSVYGNDAYNEALCFAYKYAGLRLPLILRYLRHYVLIRLRVVLRSVMKFTAP